MSRTLVLGANGFVGSHLVDSLVSNGHSVRAFDRFSSGEPLFNQSQNIEVFRGDYLNRSDLQEALKNIDYVFHFISTTTPATADNDPVLDIDTNVRMSVELFRLCVQAEIKKVIFASTGGAIYGNTEKIDSHNEKDNPQPISPYAIGKLSIENYLRYFKVKHDLDSISFRMSNPYGERQAFHRKQGVIPIFLENISRDQPVNVMGDGSMVRDYIYVKDLTSMISRVFEHPDTSEIYNIGSGVGVTINELIETAKKISGRDVVINHTAVPPTFIHKVVLDTTKFVNDFGLTPTTSLEDGMTATYRYIQNKIERTKR